MSTDPSRAEQESSAPPADAVPPPSPATPSSAERKGPRIRIGSQRPGSRKVEAKSQAGFAVEDRPAKKAAVPNIRDQLSTELELEVAEAMGDLSLEEALAPGGAPVGVPLEVDSRQRARVVQVHHDDVFVELPGMNQGVISARNFAEPPQPGQLFEAIVSSFDGVEGLYHLALPAGAVEVENWADVAEGMIVEARITGHNKGGLECEVSRLRGFIPAGQISMYRVEDLAQFVGQKMNCLVTEVNPERRNLVLSRRAVLEREKAEAKELLLSQLAEGQIREGTVRALMDFGAFVDLGGVDGLLHVSQLSWKRVKHPSEVLAVGQPIRVMIKKIDPQTRKISLAFRDLSENPWTTAAAKYPVTSRVRGVVSRIMDFGAFVEVEPGVEGLVHISELSHQRVFRVSDVVKEGDQVEAKVLSIDSAAQRMSLSMKAIAARPEPPQQAEDESEPEPQPLPPSTRKEPLKGGLERPQGGEKFGLKW